MARADGSPIVAGTVNVYLRAESGANAGLWYRGSDQTWQAAESVAGAAAHVADGHWELELPAEAWTDRVVYCAYLRESGDLHIPGDSEVCCAASRRGILPVPRIALTALARSSGDPILAGTVNFYLRAQAGDNAGKWYRGSDGSWQAAESVAGAGVHLADGHWEWEVPAGLAWEPEAAYFAYLRESGNLHIPTGAHYGWLYRVGTDGAGEPAAPVKEEITQAVVAALEEISVANGYANDVAEVVRPRRTGERFLPKDKGVSVLQGPEERSEEDDLVGNPPALGWRLPISCDVVVRVSETSATPMDQALNSLEADVRKALMVDCQFGGLAIRSELGGTDYPEGASGVEGLTVWLYVYYRVSEDDPYENRA